MIYYLDDVDAESHCFSIIPESAATKRALPTTAQAPLRIDDAATAYVDPEKPRWLDAFGRDPLYLPRYAHETKATRRADAAKDYCIVAILGDTWEDFDGLFLDVAEPASAASALDILIGEAWFLGPAPLNPKG